jgi:quinol monooxygenase YgiN
MNHSLIASIQPCSSKPRGFFTRWRLVAGLSLAALLGPGRVLAQADGSRTQVALIVVDATQLDHYQAALKEQAEAAMRIEPGVLMLYAVADKKNPTHITIMERYASETAYQAHLKSSHFLKYKATVKDMVKSLELVESTPLALEAKAKR